MVSHELIGALEIFSKNLTSTVRSYAVAYETHADYSVAGILKHDLNYYNNFNFLNDFKNFSQNYEAFELTEFNIADQQNAVRNLDILISVLLETGKGM